jgi:hypothetical protein
MLVMIKLITFNNIVKCDVQVHCKVKPSIRNTEITN